MPFRERAPHGEIATFDITQFAHRVQNWLPSERVAAEGYEADAVHLPFLLRLDGERRREEAGREHSFECSPFHYSIT